MGNLLQTRESYLEEEKASGRLNRDTLRFPGFKDNDQEFLKNQKDAQDVFNRIADIIGRLASFTGLPDAIGTILKVANSQVFDSNIELAMLELKIEIMIVNTVHSLVKAEMSSVTRQLNLINDPQLPDDQKRNHLAIADDSCHKLLVKFCDDGFYLKKHPQAFAPFLMSFLAVYVPIATANYQMTPTEVRRQEYVRNMQQLKATVAYFKDNAVKERLSYIKKCYGQGDECPFIVDNFLEDHYVIHICFMTSPDVFRDVYDWYTEKVKGKYAQYFQPGLRSFENLQLQN